MVRASLVNALLFVASALTLNAQAIVGAWVTGDSLNPSSDGTEVVVFTSDGGYYQIETNSTDQGFERGVYTWNESTEAFSSATYVDTNGNGGLSAAGLTSLTVSGDTLAGNYTRITGTTDIVGAWTYGDVTSSIPTTITWVLVFLNNGVYFYAECGTADSTGWPGVERGTYTWDPVTGTLNITSVLVNTDGDWGLSDDPPTTLTISGDTMTSSYGTFHRVTAVPEPATYALLIGLVAVGLAWHRRCRERR